MHDLQEAAVVRVVQRGADVFQRFRRRQAPVVLQREEARAHAARQALGEAVVHVEEGEVHLVFSILPIFPL